MDIVPNTSDLPEKNKVENFEFMEANLTDDKVAIVMVDDDPFVCEAWSHALQIRNFYSFDSPSQFLNWAEKNTDKIPTIRCLILDFYFTNDIDGETLARELRRQTAKSAFAKIPIVLCTDGALDSMDNTLFEAMIPKDPISLKDLLEILGSKVA